MKLKIAGLVILFAVFSILPNAFAAQFNFTPRVSASETYTDNLNLSEDDKEDDADMNNSHDSPSRSTQRSGAQSPQSPGARDGSTRALGFDGSDATAAQDFAARAVQKAYREWREMRIQFVKGMSWKTTLNVDEGEASSPHAEAHDVGPDPRPRRRSIAEDVPTILPSIHLSKETRNGAGGGEAKDHVSESGDVEANLTTRTGVAAAEQVRQKRPQTAAVNPKMLRFAPEAYRPQSAAITPTRAQQQQQKHL